MTTLSRLRGAPALALVLGILSCGSGDPVTGVPDADVRILYIGNSLTYVNDIPGLVQKMADLDGRSTAHAEITAPNYALEDHWAEGLEKRIRAIKPDVVVMQQGPSSLPESRTNLVEWSARIAGVVREVGGEVALYMVWPASDRQFAFTAVAESYSAAARAAGGRLLPAGMSWAEAWERDPQLQLYAEDGVHASYAGSLLAAETIYSVLFDVDPAAIPRLDDGVSDAQRAVFAEAIASSVVRWRVGD